MSIFKLPDLGEGLSDAEIREWHVKIGDHVEVDEPLVAVETAKAIVEVPSPQRGIIKKLFANAGETVATGASLVEFEGNDKSSETVAGKIESGDALLEEVTMITTNYRDKKVGIKITPAVRALAKKLGVDLESVTPTGPNGVITARDVESEKKNPLAANAAIPLYERGEELSSIRKTMHNIMLESQRTVVPATICDDAETSNWNSNQDITIRLIRALVMGCKKEPILNSWFDANILTLNLKNNIDLGLAVDSLDGLFVPVLRNIENSDFGQNLRDKLNNIKNNIKNRTINSDDLKNPTIVLSNVGIYGTKYSTPIVVPPTVAIIASGKIYSNPNKTIPLSLTFNHRVITGGEAARFLQAMIDDLTLAE